MTDKPDNTATSTQAVHAGTSRKQPHHTLAAPIAQTATYTFDDTADLERYMRGEDPDPEREEYGRYGNPTVRELEKRIAALEAADDAVAFASGMAAVSTATLALLKAGDHVVLFRDCYRRTRQLVVGTLARFGIDHSIVPPGDLDAMQAALRDNTRLVISESPTNPYLYCIDLERLVAVVKARKRIRTLVDATFATPVNCRPLGYGVDLVVHSATKYLAGHNDVLGGVVAGPSHLVSLVREARGVLGSVLDPHAAFLIARGLKTLGVRVERQNATALAVARMLEAHPAVQRVYYPGLPSHPSHEIATRPDARRRGRRELRGGRRPRRRLSRRGRLPAGADRGVPRRRGDADRAAGDHELFRAFRGATQGAVDRSGADPPVRRHRGRRRSRGGCARGAGRSDAHAP